MTESAGGVFQGELLSNGAVIQADTGDFDNHPSTTQILFWNHWELAIERKGDVGYQTRYLYGKFMRWTITVFIHSLIHLFTENQHDQRAIK